MKRFLTLVLAGVTAALAVSCAVSRPESMTAVQKLQIKVTPEVLAAVDGRIPVTFTIAFPKGYFCRDAVMITTPVIVYDGGTAEGQACFYQGERVKENYKTVPAKGGIVKEVRSFDFVPGMEKCHLELRSVVLMGATEIKLPTIRIADGCNTTYMLAELNGSYSLREDGYQEVVKKSTEGRILYDVNSAKVKKSELRGESIRDYQESVENIKKKERTRIRGTQIIAYASPEGGKKLNDKLSDNRASTAEKAWDTVGKGQKASSLEIKSIGQDWEGFQEAVAQSDIEDKNLILRVLSMYSDPAVRESEIRNMSQIYGEIKKDVFPELRRARFVTEYEYDNYTAEELKELADNQIHVLDEAALLRAAANETDWDRKGLLYRIAHERFGSEKALFNLAAIYLDRGQNGVAEMYLNQMADQDDPDVLNAKGVVEMRKRNYKDAEDYFEHAATDEAKENLGTLYIIKGDYAAAVDALKGTGSRNRALACILAGDLDGAQSVIDPEDPRAGYFRAIIAARRGDNARAEKELGALSGELKSRAATDIEFSKVQ
ncbi:MAG: hypothetical protein MJY44_06435 [Bacteroidales bacterium]|nr:hypothetical protein [Bacteroidales bacterium]